MIALTSAPLATARAWAAPPALVSSYLQGEPGPRTQDPAAQQPEVRDAKVEGNVAVKETTILDNLGIKRGQPYNPLTVRAGIKRLWAGQGVRVDEVRIETVGEGVVNVYVKVYEQPSAGPIEIRGNVAFEQKDLLIAGGVEAAPSLDEVKAERLRRDLLRFYAERGYLFADIRLHIDPESRKAIYDVMEGPLVRINSLDFSGNKAFAARTFLGFGRHLTEVMELRQRFLFFRGSEYSEKKLRQDLVQLRKFYRQLGYRDAVVEFAPPRFSEDGALVDLTILIDEGRLYRVSSIDVIGVKAFPKEEVLARVKTKPGDPYTFENVMTDFRSIQRFYGERGYPRHASLKDSWQIKEPKEVFSEDENEALVDLTYEVVENTPKFVRDIKVVGNRVTQDRVIRRVLTFNPGEQVDQTKIEQSIMRLDSLQYFDNVSTSVNYRYIDTPDPAWKDVAIQVAEGRTGQAALSGGINTNDGLFAVLSFTKRNFDIGNLPSSLGNALPEIVDGTAFTGAGQELTAQLAPGVQVSQYDLRFTEPDLFGDHVRAWLLSADIYYRVRRYTENTEERLGQLVSIGKSLDDNWSIDGTLRNETVDIVDIAFNAPSIIFAEEGSNALRTLRFGITYRDQDLVIEPTRGTFLRLEQETGGGPLGGDINYQKVIGTYRGWFPLGTDSENHPHTLFAQARAGFGIPTNGDDIIPYSERFYLGGEGTIRGFRFRGVGPVELGSPIGGEVFYVGTLEYRFPLFSTRLPGRDDDVEVLRGVVFTDAGSVGLDFNDPTLREVRVTMGIGVRIRIPFLPQLPLAVHLGYPIARESTDDLQALTFTIGQF
jgi:outer membrane protein assembly factor BamA